MTFLSAINLIMLWFFGNYHHFVNIFRWFSHNPAYVMDLGTNDERF